MSNVPNILSAFRLVLVPFFPILYFSDIPNGKLYAGAVFVLAGMTDVLDGFLAREFHWITPLGRVLDPLADKLMQISAMTTLTVDHRLPVWFFVMFTAKEFAMLVGGLRLYRKNSDVIPSNFFGKLTAVLFYCAILITLFEKNLAPDLIDLLLAVLLALAIFALGIYYTGYKSTLKK
jgi:cardiolipin synthase